MLTQQRLKELFHYNVDTGLFTRRTQPSMCVAVGDIAGNVTADGYIRIMIDRISYLAHRLAILYVEGYLPEDTVDHINRITGDNKYKNLRVASQQCQMRNCGLYNTNTSGVKGVRWDKERNVWRAWVKVDARDRFLGRFRTKLDAAYARFAAEQCLGFQDCDINSSAKQYIDSCRGESK